MTIHLKDGRTFRQACKDSGVTFWQAYDKIRMQNMSPDSAIEYCRNLKGTYSYKNQSLRQYCIKNKVPYSSVVAYHNTGAKESFEDIIDKKLYRKNINSDTAFCKNNGIKYWNAKSRHYYAVINKDCKQSFKEFCKDCYKL